MRGSAKSPEPAELCAWKVVQGDNGIEPKYGDLQHPERCATVTSLFAEQTGQCVYCGRCIVLTKHGHYHIEHFKPRSKYPLLQLDYTNLFLSCGPDNGRGIRQSCGAHKDDWFDETSHISPGSETCAEHFWFRVSGEIVGDDSPEAEEMISVLNLNHPELVAERQVMIEDVERELEIGTPLDELCQGYSHKDHNGMRPSFANVALGYLRDQADDAT